MKARISPCANWLLIWLLLSLFAATQALAQPGASQTGDGNWTVACAPDLYCFTAANGRAPGGTATGFFRIGRHADGTYWELSLRPGGALPDTSRQLTTRIGSWSLAFTAPEVFAPFGRADDFFFLGKPAQALLDRLVPGQELEIAFTDRTGKAETLSFPLDGLAKALITIDTAQHRLGSERVAEAPPYGLFRTDVLGAAWMEPALAYYF